MKTMTCNQLGGACDKAFQANTFDEIVEQSKLHGMQMFQEQDPAHMMLMAKMTELMQNPEELQKWFASKKSEFDALAQD